MLGKPGTTRPLNSSYCAAEWTTLSPWHDRTTAMSSMHLAVCGNRSDTSIPLCAVLRELAGRAEQLGALRDELVLGLAELCRPRLAVELVQERLGVERVEVARPAGHEQEDDALRLRLEVRLLRGERVGERRGPGRSASRDARASAAEPAEGVGQELAAVAGQADAVHRQFTYRKAFRLNTARANSLQRLRPQELDGQLPLLRAWAAGRRPAGRRVRPAPSGRPRPRGGGGRRTTRPGRWRACR